jgi:phosphoesterase RecJ-like protein
MINKVMFETKSKSFLELDLLARKTLEYHFDDRCAIITITQKMYEQSGSNEHECYPITALPRQIEGVLVGAVIKEKQNGAFGISVRTEGDIDASEICARLGGGGHAGAAGCEVKEDYETAKAKILESIRASLGC